MTGGRPLHPDPKYQDASFQSWHKPQSSSECTCMWLLGKLCQQRSLPTSESCCSAKCLSMCNGWDVTLGSFKVQKYKKSPLRLKGSSNADTHIARWAARLLMYYVESTRRTSSPWTMDQWTAPWCHTSQNQERLKCHPRGQASSVISVMLSSRKPTPH